MGFCRSAPLALQARRCGCGARDGPQPLQSRTLWPALHPGTYALPCQTLCRLRRPAVAHVPLLAYVSSTWSQQSMRSAVTRWYQYGKCESQLSQYHSMGHCVYSAQWAEPLCSAIYSTVGTNSSTNAVLSDQCRSAIAVECRRTGGRTKPSEWCSLPEYSRVPSSEYPLAHRQRSRTGRCEGVEHTAALKYSRTYSLSAIGCIGSIAVQIRPATYHEMCHALVAAWNSPAPLAAPPVSQLAYSNAVPCRGPCML